GRGLQLGSDRHGVPSNKAFKIRKLLSDAFRPRKHGELDRFGWKDRHDCLGDLLVPLCGMDIGFLQQTPSRVTRSSIVTVAAFSDFLGALPAILVHSTPPALRALRDLATYGKTNM